MRVPAVLLSALVVFDPGGALAWGKTGHRVTAQIAEHYLSSCSRKAVQRLLGVEDLAEASTWADEMRASPDPYWKTVEPHHYVTIPAGRTYVEVGPPPEGDAMTALKRFESILRDRSAPTAQKQLALRFIVHLVADLHQPLHVGNGDDRGGNDVKVRFMGEETNLHTVWDSKLIDQQQLSYSEYSQRLLRRIDAAKAAEWKNADPAVWIAESDRLRPGIYPGSLDLSWRYVFDHMATAELRLAQGGVRTSAFLNRLFGEDGSQCTAQP